MDRVKERWGEGSRKTSNKPVTTVARAPEGGRAASSMQSRVQTPVRFLFFSESQVVFFFALLLSPSFVCQPPLCEMKNEKRNDMKGGKVALFVLFPDVHFIAAALVRGRREGVRTTEPEADGGHFAASIAPSGSVTANQLARWRGTTTPLRNG